MPTTIVVVGGGFAGLLAAKKIKQRLGTAVDITIIDKKEYFLFSPRLIDALAGQTSPESLKRSLPEWSQKHHMTFIRGEVLSVDRTHRTVTYQTSPNRASLPYDILLLAPGARTNFQYLPLAETKAVALKTEEDVERIQVRIRELLTTQKHPAIVVIGGGPSGIEGLAALKLYSERFREEHPSLPAPACSFTLIQAAPQLLPGFPSKVVQATGKELERQGIRVLTGDPVTDINERELMTAGGKKVPADLVLWSAGISPNLIPFEPALEEDPLRGLVVDESLRLEPRIFAAGDIANYRERNVTVPKNAQTAMGMASHVAKNIVRTLREQPLRPFRYRSKGNLLLLGKTGIFDFKYSAITNRFIPGLRDLFYRFREWQILK